MLSFTIVPKDFPRCGACIYWSGEKEVLMNGVKYDMYSYGKCSNSVSPSYGKNLMADNCCGSKKDF